jgi:hypothetical protein
MLVAMATIEARREDEPSNVLVRAAVAVPVTSPAESPKRIRPTTNHAKSAPTSLLGSDRRRARPPTGQLASA